MNSIAGVEMNALRGRISIDGIEYEGDWTFADSADSADRMPAHEYPITWAQPEPLVMSMRISQRDSRRLDKFWEKFGLIRAIKRERLPFARTASMRRLRRLKYRRRPL
jgi:hypothetical protein